MKLEVKKNTKTFYYEFFTKTIQVPLQLGKGTYIITLYKNTSGEKYIANGKITIDATIMPECAYMLSSN